MEFLTAAYTDTGIQKPTNQDSLAVCRAAIPACGEALLAVVCDGMGGLQKGEVASAMAVETFGGWFAANYPYFSTMCGADLLGIRHQWEALVDQVHQAILQYSGQAGVQMGTTLAAFFAYGDRYLIMNIGDSRIYERKKKLRQLTQDQSLVAREIAAGRITEEQSRHHPQRNVLLQCLGVGPAVTPDFAEGRIRNETLFLLTSDGLSHELSPEELEEALQPDRFSTKEPMTATLQQLTERCKSRGETDNLSAVLIKSRESEVIPQKNGLSQKLKQLFRPAATGLSPAAPTLLENTKCTCTPQSTLETPKPD